MTAALSRRGSKLAATGLGLLTAGGIAQYMRAKRTSDQGAPNPQADERAGSAGVPPTG